MIILDVEIKKGILGRNDLPMAGIEYCEDCCRDVWLEARLIDHLRAGKPVFKDANNHTEALIVPGSIIATPST